MPAIPSEMDCYDALPLPLRMVLSYSPICLNPFLVVQFYHRYGLEETLLAVDREVRDTLNRIGVEDGCADEVGPIEPRTGNRLGPGKRRPGRGVVARQNLCLQGRSAGHRGPGFKLAVRRFGDF